MLFNSVNPLKMEVVEYHKNLIQRCTYTQAHKVLLVIFNSSFCQSSTQSNLSECFISYNYVWTESFENNFAIKLKRVLDRLQLHIQT